MSLHNKLPNIAAVNPHITFDQVQFATESSLSVKSALLFPLKQQKKSQTHPQSHHKNVIKFKEVDPN